MTDAPAPEALAPAPAGSPLGRSIATIYLVVVGLAFAVLVYELMRGQHGIGSIAVSVLTAPWSAALALVAQALAGSLPEGAMRVLGFTLAFASALLNARILYGMAARAERDFRPQR